MFHRPQIGLCIRTAFIEGLFTNDFYGRSLASYMEFGIDSKTLRLLIDSGFEDTKILELERSKGSSPAEYYLTVARQSGSIEVRQFPKFNIVFYAQAASTGENILTQDEINDIFLPQKDREIKRHNWKKTNSIRLLPMRASGQDSIWPCQHPASKSRSKQS